MGEGNADPTAAPRRDTPSRIRIRAWGASGRMAGRYRSASNTAAFDVSGRRPPGNQ